jgi:hypothetical protein
MSTEVGKKEKRIGALIARLAGLGAMRPGTLTVQYRDPAAHRTPFHQLSYTHQGHSRSEYVRPESLAAVKREVEAYREFRRIVQQITDISLEASRLRHRRQQPAPRTRPAARGTTGQ